jgi:hypothetical protein
MLVRPFAVPLPEAMSCAACQFPSVWSASDLMAYEGSIDVGGGTTLRLIEVTHDAP